MYFSERQNFNQRERFRLAASDRYRHVPAMVKGKRIERKKAKGKKKERKKKETRKIVEGPVLKYSSDSTCTARCSCNITFR